MTSAANMGLPSDLYIKKKKKGRPLQPTSFNMEVQCTEYDPKPDLIRLEQSNIFGSGELRSDLKMNHHLSLR